MPCAEVPMANPRAIQPTGSVPMRSNPNSALPLSAPTRPVTTANTAASEGTPPILSAMPMATGAVTDLGASDSIASRGRSSAQAIATALPAAAPPPTTAARVKRAQWARSCTRRSHSGQASATTAGPSRKWMNCAPAK